VAAAMGALGLIKFVYPESWQRLVFWGRMSNCLVSNADIKFITLLEKVKLCHK